MHVAYGLSIEKTLFAIPIMHTNTCTGTVYHHFYKYFFSSNPPPPSTFLNGRVDNQDDISAIPVLTWVITID